MFSFGKGGNTEKTPRGKGENSTSNKVYSHIWPEQESKLGPRQIKVERSQPLRPGGNHVDTSENVENIFHQLNYILNYITLFQKSKVTDGGYANGSYFDIKPVLYLNIMLWDII